MSSGIHEEAMTGGLVEPCSALSALHMNPWSYVKSMFEETSSFAAGSGIENVSAEGGAGEELSAFFVSSRGAALKGRVEK